MMVNFIHNYSYKKHCFLSKMVIRCDEKLTLEKILISEKELSDINFERSKNALEYIKNDLIDFDDNMYLTVDLLININNNNWFK